MWFFFFHWNAVKIFFIRLTGRGRKRAPKCRLNTPPPIGTLRRRKNFFIYKQHSKSNVVVICGLSLYITTRCTLFISKLSKLFVDFFLTYVWRGSHIFSHISWTTIPIPTILSFLKSYWIQLKYSEKINSITFLKGWEKGIQTRRLYTPPLVLNVSQGYIFWPKAPPPEEGHK